MTPRFSPNSWRSGFGKPGLDTNLAVFAGLLLTCGLPPVPWTGVLVPLALAIFFGVLVHGSRPGRLAWFFGFAHQASLLHWLFFLDPSKSIPSRALVPVQAILAMAYVSVFYLLLGLVAGRLRDRWGKALTLGMLPVLWTATEALRCHGELGFSWCLSGSCTIGTPLMSTARTSGEIGIGAGMALLAATLAAVWTCRRDDKRTRRPHNRTAPILLAATLIWWSFLLIGARLQPERPQAWTAASVAAAEGTPLKSLHVAAVQPDVALADKWIKARIDSTRIPLNRLTRAAGAADADLVIWPETALPRYLRYEVPLLNWIRTIIRESSVFLFTGFPDAEQDPEGNVRHLNSSGLFAPDGTLLDRYAKHHLLPIGEAMPFARYLPFLAKVDVGQAEWTAGASPAPMTVATEDGVFHFSALVCFESVFAELARRAVRQGSQALVVITNDGWFGRTAGPRQHALLARLRAVENDVPVIRCANNGISFICDRDGRYLAWLDLGERDFISADVEPGRGRTLYVRYGAWPLFGFLTLLTVVGLAVLRRPGR